MRGAFYVESILDLADGDEAQLVEGLSELVGDDGHEHGGRPVGNIVELHFAGRAGSDCFHGRTAIPSTTIKAAVPIGTFTIAWLIRNILFFSFFQNRVAADFGSHYTVKVR